MTSPTHVSPVGGFFELELPIGPANYHSEATALASGRACLGLLMQQLRPTRVWLPFYICDSVLHALEHAKVRYSFYALTEELELATLPKLEADEYLLYVNYFGLKSAYVAMLVEQYGTQLLQDLTQAFFERPQPGQWGFNSARKFFGVPDGAYLYSPSAVEPVEANRAISLTHLLERQLGRQSAAYTAYSHYEEGLSYEPRSISDVSRSWLSWLDYAAIARQRQANFKLYQELLAPLVSQPDPPARQWLPLPEGAGPFCYPLRLTQEVPDRRQLFEQQIFVPWLWPEMRQRPGDFSLEKSFVDGVLALPLDHRYGPAEIQRVAQAVITLLA